MKRAAGKDRSSKNALSLKQKTAAAGKMPDRREKNWDFPVGSVVGFLGLKGEVKVRTGTNNPALLLDIENILALKKEKGQTKETELRVLAARCHQRLLILQFAGYDDRTSTEQFFGAELFTNRSELSDLAPEEFWVKDLVGLKVFTVGGQEIGTVASIIYGGNDLLEIQRDDLPAGKTILVPFVKDLVPTVDLKGGRIEVVDLPGLFEAQ